MHRLGFVAAIRLEIPVETNMPLDLATKCHDDSHMTVYEFVIF